MTDRPRPARRRRTPPPPPRGKREQPASRSWDRRLAQLAQPGDLILTVGAGDIFRAGELLLAGQEKGPAGN